MFRQDELAYLIDYLGNESAKAQCLKTPITTHRRLLDSDHRIYFLWIYQEDEDRFQHGSTNNPHGSFDKYLPTSMMGKSMMVIGLLKVGRKRLFLNDSSGRLMESNPLCVLDFYIAEAFQRKGYGYALFKEMLSVEGKNPEDLAIDRPSKKMVQFLSKNFDLSETLPQPNNYVLFKKTRKIDSGMPSSAKQSNHPSKGYSIPYSNACYQNKEIRSLISQKQYSDWATKKINSKKWSNNFAAILPHLPPL